VVGSDAPTIECRGESFREDIRARPNSYHGEPDPERAVGRAWPVGGFRKTPVTGWHCRSVLPMLDWVSRAAGSAPGVESCDRLARAIMTCGAFALHSCRAVACGPRRRHPRAAGGATHRGGIAYYCGFDHPLVHWRAITASSGLPPLMLSG